MTDIDVDRNINFPPSLSHILKQIKNKIIQIEEKSKNNELDNNLYTISTKMLTLQNDYKINSVIQDNIIQRIQENMKKIEILEKRLDISSNINTVLIFVIISILLIK